MYRSPFGSFGRNAMALIAALALPAIPFGVDQHRYALPGGRIHRSRSRYTPAGTNRNCNERGISPKRVRNLR